MSDLDKVSNQNMDEEEIINIETNPQAEAEASEDELEAEAEASEAEAEASEDELEAEASEAEASEAEAEAEAEDEAEESDAELSDVDISDDEMDEKDDEVVKPTATKKTKTKKISKNPDDVLGTNVNELENIETTIDDYDSEEDDFEAEDYQKLDEEMRKNYIVMNHPESISQNYDEIYKLSKVVRNKNNIIIDDAHRTLPMLTKYEKARVLGVRAKQLNNGAIPFIEIKENIIDGYLIAEKELAEKKIPFIIRRPLPNRTSEYWRLEDLEII